MADIEIILEHQEIVDALNLYLKERLGTEDYKNYKFEVVKQFPDTSISEIRVSMRTTIRNLKGREKK